MSTAKNEAGPGAQEPGPVFLVRTAAWSLRCQTKAREPESPQTAPPSVNRRATPKTDQAWPFFLATFFLATFFLATFFLAIEWLLATGTRTMELTASVGAL